MILNLTFRTLALRQCPIRFDKEPTLKMSAVFKTLCGGQFSISSKLINPVKTLPPSPPPPPHTHTHTHPHTLSQHSSYFRNLSPSYMYYSITVLTVTAFYLPPDSGERITLVITNLLAMTVFMLLVADIMPSTSEVIPVISIYFSGAIFEVCLSTLLILKSEKCQRRSLSKNILIAFGRIDISLFSYLVICIIYWY